ncbi:FliA/WhiG family RNA polymerase sigma factor [Mariprofundus ferrooxydans]|uniref:RNA polymerase sigma factor for flagellar operon n=1 Tax=Mariprofundus ferrooxydans PV-1 TaxID=314345 RepID=Q0EZ50_9PROT|nr:FliA/WhiG family RNA polymerase sigma factor [Mariprofundus ferrooxydans]EAU54574.1 RNA polymerase sigma factor for flagellar operon [Mariprofundus ferrooxydans PV-1]KON48817.1 RNA polymerase subunit sigma [Mariprofundus ferrooxydans]
MNTMPNYSITPTPDELLEEYLPLVRYHADQLMRRTPDSIEFDDLINAGVLGLLDGAQRFDHSRDVQFKTFVSYRVRGAMIDYLRAFDWMPRGLRDHAKEMQTAFQQLEQVYGRPAEETEIAKHLNISLDEYRTRLTNVRSMSIIHFDDLPVNNDFDDEISILETLAGDPADTPEAQNSLMQFVQQLADGISRLPAREQVLVTLYYYEELTMKEIALILGLTESRVSQLHSQMVVRLRGLMGLD